MIQIWFATVVDVWGSLFYGIGIMMFFLSVIFIPMAVLALIGLWLENLCIDLTSEDKEHAKARKAYRDTLNKAMDDY